MFCFCCMFTASAMLFPFVSPRFSSVFLQKPLAGVKSITASTALYWKTRLRRSCFARALTAAETLRSLKDGDVAAERINQVGVFEQEILYWVMWYYSRDWKSILEILWNLHICPWHLEILPNFGELRASWNFTWDHLFRTCELKDTPHVVDYMYPDIYRYCLKLFKYIYMNIAYIHHIYYISICEYMYCIISFTSIYTCNLLGTHFIIAWLPCTLSPSKNQSKLPRPSSLSSGITAWLGYGDDIQVQVFQRKPV